MSTPSKETRAHQTTVIDKHERRTALLRDIEHDNGSSAQISRRYGISVAAVRMHRHRYMVMVAKKRDERGMRSIDGLLQKLEAIADRAEEDMIAFREYLADPRDPKKLWMGLQAEELVAHYEVDSGETRHDGSPITKRKTSQLSELIARLGEEGKAAFEFTIKRDDTRRLYHDAMRLAMEVIDRAAKLQGMIKDVRIQISRTETWSFVMSDILVATEKFPEARAAIIARFEEKAKELTDA